LSWWILLISTLAIWLNAIDRVLLPTLMPAIMQEFRLSEVQAGWLNSLSFVGVLLLCAIPLYFVQETVTRAPPRSPGRQGLFPQPRRGAQSR